MGFHWDKVLKGVAEATQAASTLASAVSEQNQKRKTTEYAEKKLAASKAVKQRY